MKTRTKQNTKHLLLLLILIALGTQLQAQKFAEKAFYLIDSIELEKLDNHDVHLLDTILSLYKNSNNDTLKLEYLQTLSNELYDGLIWPKYNDLILEEIYKIRERTKDPNILKTCYYFEGAHYNNKGYLFHTQRKTDKVLDCYYKAYDSFVKNENSAMAGHAISEIGIIYYTSGDLILALQKFQVSNKLLEKNDDSDSFEALSKNYKNIGNIYTDFKDSIAAENSFAKALHYGKRASDDLRVAYVFHSMSIFSFKNNNYTDAKYYLDSAVLIFEKRKHYRGLSIMKSSYGIIASEENNYKEADAFFQKGMQLAKNKGTFDAAEFSYLNYAEFLLKIENLVEAEKYLNKIKEITTKGEKIVQHSKKLTNLMRTLYVKKKDYRNAYLVQEAFYSLKDSMYSDDLRKALIKHDINSEYEKQKEIDDLINQQKLDLAEEQKKNTTIALFAAAIISAMIAIFSLFIFNRLKLIRKQKTELDSAYEQLEESKKNELAVSNLKALQSQMNPHFIFNALNSVQDLVLLKDIRNSNKYLGKFSDLIRKILLSSKEQFIPLSEEVEILKLYLDLEKLRFGEDFEIDFECNVPEEKQDEIKLPAMFIQPYIENAIKHGLFHKEGKKELTVHFNLMPNTLECIVKDNGIGQVKAAEFKQKRLHLHTGFSTEAINERIRLLNETLDEKIELQIEDLYENEIAVGTKISLNFPLMN